MHIQTRPKEFISQNSPQQNDQVTKYLLLQCMHNIPAHSISVCSRGGHDFFFLVREKKKKEPRQPE